MSKRSKSSTPPPDEPLTPLERMARRLEAHMRDSGRTVEVMEPSDTTEFVVTLPQGQRPKATPRAASPSTSTGSATSPSASAPSSKRPR